MIKRLVSSVNSQIVEPVSFTILLIYNSNIKGSKFDPCGTQAQMKGQSEQHQAEKLVVFCQRDYLQTKRGRFL